MTTHHIDRATGADHERLRQVVLDAIHGQRSRYNAAQTAAWADNLPSSEEWAARLADQCVFAAHVGSKICGFMSITPDGLVDLAFIRPDHQGSGLFRKLIAAIEKHARSTGIEQLLTKASLNAEGPFFNAGFTAVEREEACLNGITLVRLHMTKPLLALGDKYEPEHA